MIFNEEQLKDKDFFNSIKDRAQDIIIYDQFREAYDLAKSLKESMDKIKDFKERNYDLYYQYKDIIYKLKWIGMPIMTEDMVINYFKHHFAVIFKIPEFNYEELMRKLDTVLLGILVFADRDKFKEKLRNALMNNGEKITSAKLIINNKEELPTVGNWVKDYNSALGTDAVDNLKRIQYFTNNKNIKNLDDNEKKKVKTLLDLYERLKLSSLTLEGLEEDIPVDENNIKGIIKRGVFEPLREEKLLTNINQRETKSTKGELQTMLAQYPPHSLERKAIEEEIAKLDR